MRPLLPVDETRYLSVAWEMWRDGHVLVPILNGEPYADKPPLLFWLIEAVWLATGVSETVARLIPPAAGIAAMGLTGWLARLLWPTRQGLAGVAMLMVVASPIVLIFATLVRFDILLTCWVLLALAGVLKVWRTGDRRWWLMFGLGIGLGLLTKGPVVLVLTLPAALFAPLWMAQKPDGGWGRWYGGTGMAVAMAAAIGLAWVLPAAFTGGEEYRDLILWHQTAGRIANAFDHKRPFYYYVIMLPVLLLPWLMWRPLWRGVRALVAAPARDAGLRFCLVWAGAAVVLLSGFDSKQIYYLIPIVPAFGLIASRAAFEVAARSTGRDVAVIGGSLLAGALVLALLVPAVSMVAWAFPDLRLPPWLGSLGLWAPIVLALGVGCMFWLARRGIGGQALGLAVASLALFAAIHVAGAGSFLPYYDLGPIARVMRDHPAAPLTYSHDYTGEFGFLARLDRPVAWTDAAATPAWLAAHPGGLAVLRYKERPTVLVDQPLLEIPYRGGKMGVWLAPGGAVGG